MFVLDHRNVAKERRPLSLECISAFSGGSRPQAAATGCYRAYRATEPAGAVSARSGHAPCRATTIGSDARTQRRRPRPTCLHPRAPSLPNPWGGTFYPTASSLQPCSGLSRHGLEACEPVERLEHRPAFDSPCARLLSAIAGRGEETGLSGRTKKLTTASTGHIRLGTSRCPPASSAGSRKSARFAWPFPNQCNKGLTRNCGPVRGAYWAHLTNICRKPTLFFHDPSQSCTIYLLDRLFVSKADFAANVSLARKGALVMRSPPPIPGASWRFPRLPANTHSQRQSSPCKMISRGRAACRH